MSIQCVALFGNQDRAGPPGLSLVTTKTIPTYRTRGPRREAAPTPPPGRWPACTSRGWPDILQKQVRPGGLIRKCVPQETGIGTRTGCHVKWKPHAKSSPGFCNTKTGARCRQQPAYKNRQAAIRKHLRARQRPAKNIGHRETERTQTFQPGTLWVRPYLGRTAFHFGHQGASGLCSGDQPRPLSPAACRSLIPRRQER